MSKFLSGMLLVAVLLAVTGSGLPLLHTKIILYATQSSDRNVLVWHNREALRKYLSGTFTVRYVLNGDNTFVAVAFNRAEVVQLDKDSRIVGIHIISGPYKGHYGWINSNDFLH